MRLAIVVSGADLVEGHALGAHARLALGLDHAAIFGLALEVAVTSSARLLVGDAIVAIAVVALGADRGVTATVIAGRDFLGLFARPFGGTELGHAGEATGGVAVVGGLTGVAFLGDALRELVARLAELEHDLELVSLSLEPGTAALVLVTEDRWAGPLSEAAGRVGGRIVAGERIPPARLRAALHADQDEPGRP